MEKTKRMLRARQSRSLRQHGPRQALTATHFANTSACALDSKEKDTDQWHKTNVECQQANCKSERADLVWCLNIGDSAIDRWRKIGISEGLNSDTEIVLFLIAHYEQSLLSQPRGTLCRMCGTPLSQTCEFCHAPCMPYATTIDTAATSADSTYSVNPNLQAKTVAAGVVPVVKEEDSNSARVWSVMTGEPDMTRPVAEDDGHTDPPSSSSEMQAEADITKADIITKTNSMNEEQRAVCVRKCGHTKDSGAKSFVLKRKTQGYKCMHLDCGSVFTKSSRLKAHSRIHTGEKPYICKVCSNAFTQKSGLTVHMRKHTGKRPFSCGDCPATFPSASTLKQHQRRHTGEKPYCCGKCDKTFRWSGHLTQHMRMHEGIKPFLCPDCGKSFSASSDLVKHRVTHTNDRPYKCDKCDKAYAFQHRLTAHKRSHTGDRPFLCTVCGSAFARTHNLTVHMRTHTGDKPYICQDCGSKFSDSGNFSKHKKSKHSTSEQSQCIVYHKQIPKKKSIAAGGRGKDLLEDTDHVMALHQELPDETSANVPEPKLGSFTRCGLVETKAESDHGADVSLWKTTSCQVRPSQETQASEMLQRAARVAETTNGGKLPGMVMLVSKKKLKQMLCGKTFPANVIAVDEMSNLLSSTSESLPSNMCQSPSHCDISPDLRESMPDDILEFKHLQKLLPDVPCSISRMSSLGATSPPLGPQLNKPSLPPLLVRTSTLTSPQVTLQSNSGDATMLPLLQPSPLNKGLFSQQYKGYSYYFQQQ